MVKKIQKRNIAWLFLGLLLGALIIISAHFFTIKEESIHYHANFGLYVNGKREEFKSFGFYEEVTSCGGNNLNNPKIRTHMHDNKNYVVHVHDDAATWGHFFANLGFSLGDSVLETNKGVFLNDQDGKQLTFTLNGERLDTIANRTIGNKDVLLINYGDEKEDTLKKQYDSITKDAAKYNKTADPAACSGSKPLTFTEKIQKSIWSKSEHSSENHKH
jgi:hypothetical protein